MSNDCNLSFESADGKHYLVRGNARKELSREVMVELLQSLLCHVSPNRDYTGIASINKLMRVIDLECSPDESDDESPAPVAAKPAAKATPAPAPALAPVAAKKAARGGRRPVVPQKNDNDDDETPAVDE